MLAMALNISFIKTLLLACCLWVPFFCLGQGEANIWYFGFNAGLDFNSGNPTVLSDGQMRANEACASIADENGALLFYSDGVNIWNKNHAIMSNGSGLLGGSSSSQMVVLKKPASDNRYLLFAIDQQAGDEGLTYSEIDMSAEGGLGAVTTIKNVQLFTPVCEQITAIPHDNGRDAWIIAHGWGNNTFLAFLVTPQMVSNVPVESETGLVISGGNANDGAAGILKASPQGDRLAMLTHTLDHLQLFDFNRTTGRVGNAVLVRDDYGNLFSGNTFGQAYGVEFSPSGKLLYVSEHATGVLPGNIYQYNLEASNIGGSELIVGNLVYPTALQLGPNGKIYCSRRISSAISAIDQPNVLGMGCNFIPNLIPLGTNSIGQDLIAYYGLPTYYSTGETVLDFFLTDSCENLPIDFFITANYYDSLFWNFNDGEGYLLQNSVTRTFDAAGEYLIDLVAYSNGYPDTLSKVVTIYPLNYVNANGVVWCKEKNDPYVPNGFTPNGDGFNDFFKPVFPVEFVENYALKIYNRWGGLVYETNDVTEGWNGRGIVGKGEPMIGLYNYVIDYRDEEGEKTVYGKVSVLD